MHAFHVSVRGRVGDVRYASHLSDKQKNYLYAEEHARMLMLPISLYLCQVYFALALLLEFINLVPSLPSCTH